MQQTHLCPGVMVLRALGLIWLLWISNPLPAAEGPGQQSAAVSDLTEFKTPQTAQTTSLGALRRAPTSGTGFLGISTEIDSSGKLAMVAVAPNSPAAKAGVEANDILLSIDGQPPGSLDALRKLIQSKSPGQFAKLSVLRAGQALELNARLASLGPVGRPIERIRLGVRVGGIRPEGGVRIEEVDADSPGARAGLQVGDFVLAANGNTITASNKVADALLGAGDGELFKLIVARDGRETAIQVRLASASSPDRPAASGFRGGLPTRGGFGARGSSLARKGVLNLAVIGIEFPDVKRNPRVTAKDWEQEFFSTNGYTVRSLPGQPVHGSVSDYYFEQSAGTMRIQGTVFDWVEVARNRMDYSLQPPASGGDRGNGRDAPLLNEVFDKLVAREGRDSLASFDAVIFLYAGRPASRNTTNIYWPHSASINYRNRRIRYVVVAEGGERMTDISLFCHELGHVLGLPDLYIRRTPGGQTPNPPYPNPNSSTNPIAGTGRSSSPIAVALRNANPYAENLGNWDVMAEEVGNGRPQHMGAWSKEQLGWIKPAVIDPTVRQKLVLAPIEKSPAECFKIPVRPDGSEYFLLENRRRVGFDVSVPAEGLLIWRVVYGRPVLEEAHGTAGLNAPRLDVRHVPFPTDRNDSFTPFTRPSSAAFTGDELPVYITNIRRLPDGRISFWVGYGFD